MNMPSWLKNAIFYEIYPQSFYDTNGDGIGDLQGIIQKLDYIKDMGFNAIWINPCFDSAFMDAGYDVIDYYKIAPRYGTNDDAKQLFKKAHENGIKILLDLVPGHTSDKCKWFLESKKPQKNEYTNRYIWTNGAFVYPDGFRMESGLSDRDGNYMVNFFSSQPALNFGFEERDYDWQLPPDHPDCQATVKEVKNIMKFWLDMGCDGFRVDMAYSLVKNDPHKTGTKRLWNDIREDLNRDYPEAVILSEWSVAEDAIDAGFHMDFYIHFNNKGYNALFQTIPTDYVDKADELTGFFNKKGKGDVTIFTEEFTRKFNYINGRGYMAIPTGNHDMIRYSRTRDTNDLKLISSFIMLLPCIPFVYYGDEIGMRYQQLISKEGGYFRTGSRTPMQWAKTKNLGFSTIDGDLYLPVDINEDAPTVDEQINNPNSLLNCIKKFIRFRKDCDDLKPDKPMEIVYAEKGKYPFVFKRGKLLIAVNPSSKVEHINLEGNYTEIISANGNATIKDNTLTIDSVSLVVFEKI